MKAPSRAVLVPPRPNLGPESLGARPSLAGRLAGVGLLLGLSVLLAVWLRNRNRKRRRRRMTAPPLVLASLPDRGALDPMTVLSEAVRDALVGRFGTSWRSKTTEEIAATIGLADLLGTERAAELVDFLKAADRAKFAARSEPVPGPQTDQWVAWSAAFVAELTAGASSTIKGK